jgi:hypothetical protein
MYEDGLSLCCVLSVNAAVLQQLFKLLKLGILENVLIN